MNSPPLDLERHGNLVAVAHLPPLPGAPGFTGDLDTTVDRAVRDARVLEEGGVDAIIVENFGDAPFFATDVSKETVAAMTRVTRAVVEHVRLPVGVNVLRNDAAAALAVAAASGASFVRVNVHIGAKWTDQGLIVGRAAETVRRRDACCPSVRILADVAVKHASPVTARPIADEAEDCYFRGRADGIVVTGRATGAAVDDVSLRAVRERLPSAPLFAGSGITPDDLAHVFETASGVIVGTAIKIDGRVTNAVDPERVRALVAARGGPR